MLYEAKTYNDILNALVPVDGDYSGFQGAVEKALNAIILQNTIRSGFDISLETEAIREGENNKYKRFLTFKLNQLNIPSGKQYGIKIYRLTGLRNKSYRWEEASIITSYNNVIENKYYANNAKNDKYPRFDVYDWYNENSGVTGDFKDFYQFQSNNTIRIDLNNLLLNAIKPKILSNSGYSINDTEVRFIGQRNKNTTNKFAYSGNLTFKFVLCEIEGTENEGENIKFLCEHPRLLKIGQRNSLKAQMLVPKSIQDGKYYCILK